MRPEGPVKALRIVLAVTVVVFICMAAVDHSFSSNSIRTAATNGVILRLEGERLSLHLVRAHLLLLLLLLLFNSCCCRCCCCC